MKLNAQTVNIGLNVLVIIGLVTSTILAGVIMKETNDNVQLVINTKDLASELRQSSDDLTRFIRTYTVTGNYSYWEYFQSVLNIRNGVAPLPEEPWRNYWDLYVADGHSPRGFTPAKALLQRFREASFSSEEFALLEKAAAESDALIELEDIAAHAMAGLYRPKDATGLTPEQAKAFTVVGQPNQTLAMEIVHSLAYHHWKGNIMRPIDDFAAKSTARVRAALEANYRNNIILLAVLSTMLSTLIVLLVVYFVKVSKDSQTQHLLNAVLPVRVVDAVTVSHFTDLKEVAGQRAAELKKRRRKLGRSGQFDESDMTPRSQRSQELPNLKVAADLTFPVLYSEYLPVAWVAFTDVVSFTKMCRYAQSHVVISVLNEMFSLLDIAALTFGVEKIKTIGDAFMAAKLSTSELHDIQNEEQQNALVARDGLCMVTFLLHACQLARGVARPQPIDEKGELIVEAVEGSSLQLRVGLNAGPCASGIVGFERPLYDLFGDTVNTAARLESTGKPNRVHILESCVPYFGDLASELIFEGWTDNVELKGLGTCTTRFIKTVRHQTDTESMRSSIVATYRASTK